MSSTPRYEKLGVNSGNAEVRRTVALGVSDSRETDVFLLDATDTIMMGHQVLSRQPCHLSSTSTGLLTKAGAAEDAAL